MYTVPGKGIIKLPFLNNNSTSTSPEKYISARGRTVHENKIVTHCNCLMPARAIAPLQFLHSPGFVQLKSSYS